MMQSLYSKLALVLLILFFLIGVSFVVISVYSTDRYQQEVNQKLNRNLAALIGAEKSILKEGRIDREAMKDIFHMLMVINPSIEVYLLDREGTIMAFSAEPGRVKRTAVSLGPIRKWIDGGVELPFFGDDPRSLSGNKVFTAAPIMHDGDLEGYIYVILGGETYDSIIGMIQGSYILQLSIRVIAISLLVALAAGLLIFAYLTRRLKRFASVMDGYESGMTLDMLELPAVSEKGSEDEIDKLLATFRKMIERIDQQVKKLEQTDALRRELVANVSHDLRTPLATLRGYMETLLMKEDRLSEEERRDYLKTAIRHCERLGILIADLFELAKLEARDRVAHPEPFNMGELVQDVVQKFALSAKDRNIAITVDSGHDLPFAFADIALIERVLENLLDNALRHTPEGGKIGVVLSAENRERLSVRVSDTGSGIPEEDLPRIFDRFYQSGRSDRGKTAHSGLGLAVAKRIVALHDSSISVESVLHAGSTFTFSLPVQSAG